MRYIISLCLLIISAATASAQTVSADRFRLNTGPCVERSGSGVPTGSVVGNVCDTYKDTATGKKWWKISGTATNTGWISWDSASTALSILFRDADADSALRNLAATGVFGNGGTGVNELTVGGTEAATCASWPGCEAPEFTFRTSLITNRLRTELARLSQWSVNTDGTTINSANGGGWAPLRFGGGPTLFFGGGVQVGTSTSSDPGLGNVNIDGFVGKPGYASQTTGWRIDSLGAADFRYLFVDEMHAKSFIADLEQALAGGQIISKSVAIVGADFSVPAPGSIGTLIVEDLPSAGDMAVFESGDYVRLRQFSRASGSLSITDAWGQVTNYADLAGGLQSWTFTRLITNGGAMSTGTVIAADSLVLDYGVPGNGFYEVNAIDGIYGINSPYAQVVTWTGNSPIAANQTVRARFGNLRGITGNAEYGLLAGTYAASGGRYFIGSDQRFELHGIDLSLWNGSTRVFRMDPINLYASMGSPAPTSYSSGTGCWQGFDAGVFKWRCGDIAGGTQYIAWNGSQLTVAGNIVVTGTSIDAASVNGVAGATIVSGAQRALLGIASNGNPALPVVAAPSGSGLWLGSDKMGFYDGGAWKTYIDNAGNFYLGGTSGALQFTSGTLTISATLSGNGSGITSINGGNITTDTITATQIAASAITASELAADSVTSAKIVAGTIVASDIAASTITGDRIAASTITATNLSVSSLSAITADLGTVTAGTINGPSAIFGGSGGDVTLNADGITFTAGTGDPNKIKWDNGSSIGSGGGVSNGRLYIVGATELDLYAGNGMDLTLFGGDLFIDAPADIRIAVDGEFYVFGLNSTTGSDYPVVWSGTGEVLRHKTNGIDGGICGSGVADITFEKGIATSSSCLSPDMSPQMLRAEIESLKQELAALRALVTLSTPTMRASAKGDRR